MSGTCKRWLPWRRWRQRHTLILRVSSLAVSIGRICYGDILQLLDDMADLFLNVAARTWAFQDIQLVRTENPPEGLNNPFSIL